MNDTGVLYSRRFRLWWSALGLVLWALTCATAFVEWKFLSGIFFGLNVAWMLSVFAVMSTDPRFKVRRCTAESAITGRCTRVLGHGGWHATGISKWRVDGP